MPRLAESSVDVKSTIAAAEDTVSVKCGTCCTTELTRSSRRFNPVRLAVRVGRETRVTFYGNSPADVAERFWHWVEGNNGRVLSRTLYRPIYR